MAAQEYSGRFMPPPILKETVSPQFAFPLACRQVSHYIQPRVALVGDAAHSVHPMAGQGLNLGLQDVGNLVDVVERAAASGMDPVTFLTEYDRSRKAQVSLTITGIHALHEIFGVQHTLAKHMKSLGMNFVQNVGPVRRSLVQAACQGVAVP
jgi:2-octaprenylphenol hydroxylase